MKGENMYQILFYEDKNGHSDIVDIRGHVIFHARHMEGMVGNVSVATAFCVGITGKIPHVLGAAGPEQDLRLG